VQHERTVATFSAQKRSGTGAAKLTTSSGKILKAAPAPPKTGPAMQPCIKAIPMVQHTYLSSLATERRLPYS